MRPPEMIIKVNITKTILSTSDKLTKKNQLKNDTKSKLKQRKTINKDVELEYLNTKNESKTELLNQNVIY